MASCYCRRLIHPVTATNRHCQIRGLIPDISTGQNEQISARESQSVELLT